MPASAKIQSLSSKMAKYGENDCYVIKSPAGNLDTLLVTSKSLLTTKAFFFLILVNEEIRNYSRFYDIFFFVL